jgi:hypothetical protein
MWLLIGKSSLSVFHEDLTAWGEKSAFCVPKVPFCTRKVPHFLTSFPLVGAQFPYLSILVKTWGKFLYVCGSLHLVKQRGST